MIAADTSVLIDYFQKIDNEATRLLSRYIRSESVFLPPVVITELHGIKKRGSKEWQEFIDDIPVLEIIDERYWQRCGLMRQKLLEKGYKARLGDTLIAQSCIDHETPLLTRDQDFRHFAEHGGLKLMINPSNH